MKIKKFFQGAAMGAALLSGTASAQLEIPNDQYWDSGDPDRWRFVLAFPMLWAPSINLETLPGGTVEITFKDIVERLQMGMMFEAYVTKAWWGVFFKGMYMDISQPIDQDINIGQLVEDAVGTNPGVKGGVNVDIDLNLKMGMYDLGMSWRLWRNLRLVTLGRATQIQIDGNAQVNSDLNCSVPFVCSDFPFTDSIELNGQIVDEDFDSGKTTSWDYLLGLEYGWWFGATNRHGVNVYADAQAWGDSESAWQIDVRYMYRVSKLNNFWVGYRHYDAEMEEDDHGNNTQITLSGPLAGWAFSF